MGEIVPSVFDKVVEVLLIVNKETIYLFTKYMSLVDQIANNSKYNTYSKYCLGALDGTHLLVHLPAIDCLPFWNRKENWSQNVLGVCSFDLKLCYILPGWEGYAYDNYVLQNVIYNYNFKIALG